MLFQSKSTSRRRSNLYIFLTAHVLTDKYFRDIEVLTRQAEEGVRSFEKAKDAKLQNFTAPPDIDERIEDEEGLNLKDEMIPVTPYGKDLK